MDVKKMEGMGIVGILFDDGSFFFLFLIFMCIWIVGMEGLGV